MTTGIERCVLRWSAVVVPILLLIATASAEPHPQTSVMDEPLRLVQRARQRFDSVADYSCDFIKRERLHGQLQPDQLMRMKVRTQPFSVHLRWELPKAMAGQEACFVEGRNAGRMRVKPNKGLVSLVGWVSLATTDPRATRDSRHEITEAGLGNLLQQFERTYADEARWNRTTVQLATYEYAGRRCRRVVTIHPADAGRFKFHRSVLYFDLENGLPIRVENYDWPTNDTDANGALVESYSYANVRTNQGLGDDAFNH